jgi:hypothetical protein
MRPEARWRDRLSHAKLMTAIELYGTKAVPLVRDMLA